jgi:hypothetical protein
MLCFFLSRFTIKADFERAETLPAQPMSAGKMAALLALAGALPGGFIANASVMFFKHPPSMLWVYGVVVGAVIGGLYGVMLAGSRRPATA